MVFSNFIHSKEIMFKHAKGMRDIFGLEFHPFHEIFLFLDGDAEFISGTFRLNLKKNTLVIIPRENFHHFVVHGPEEDYQRYVLNFGSLGELDELIEEKMAEVCTLAATDEICALFEKLSAHTSDTDNYKKELLLKAVFTEILLALDTQSHSTHEKTYMSINPIVKDAVKYINKNADTINSVSEIANHVNTSVSYFSHLFRSELHIPPHKYLLEKKLIMANKLIENGMGAVTASENCGFANYSGFYKMYKKAFGYPPSKAKKH